MTSEEYD